MIMTPVSSSNLESVGYDPSTETLRIKFLKSGLYEYYNVPQDVYDGLMAASSKGKYFHNNIKDKYPYTKLE
ncbi:hypothetical protein MBORA_15820 [Methanobrevibacter oralis]|uniref:KTSC domain-containing protein n=1 Tax=Methanobrevibacter oralis TaxID=66851 RepID=A0A166C574_METOA|nr:KTSC domain-containing protein [Methanobrevibacter oralis]KZX11337.1 hypothetical protein MBORA_15820 [Methanobrevibacter oralis]